MRHRRNQRNEHIPKAFFEIDIFKTFEILFKGFFIAVYKHIGQTENTNFLNQILIYHKSGIIIKLSAVFRTHTNVIKGFFAVGVGDKSCR